MENLRKHGMPPFGIAVIHGGPGAPGEMAPVARELASQRGVLEPLQTADSLQGQVSELKTVLEDNAQLPVTLIGFSWGAWLSYIVAAEHPALIKKLVLIASGPFEEKYVSEIMETRLNRLSEENRSRVEAAIKTLDNPKAVGKDTAFALIGKLLSKADTYSAIMNEPENTDAVDCQANIFQSVWEDAAKLRRSGRLLGLGKNIQCPVVAIHGDYDPHPSEGVLNPLSTVLKDFKYFLLDNCGHKPWIERHAKDRFYEIIAEELR